MEAFESADSTGLRFHTTQELGGWALSLHRTVRLAGRTVRVETTLTNTGTRRIPIVWHPHPFYPYPSGDALFTTNLQLELQQSSIDGAYAIDGAGFVRRNLSDPQMGFLGHDPASDRPVRIYQHHPVVGMVTARASYIPSFFPVWGNAHTFSWEPYYERTVQMGIDEVWSIEYHFGEDAARL